MYVVYLAYLKLADKIDHTFLILRCPQCGIPFLTKTCNRGRTDILCTFGCKQNHQKAQARKRSKKYAQKKMAKAKKKKANQQRSLVGHTPQIKSLSKKVDPFILYLKFILQSILLTKIQTHEIIEILNKVSSRGLSFYQKLIHHSDYG